MYGLNNEDRVQLFMETKKKPIKTSIVKIGTLIEDIEEEFLNKIEEVLQSQDEIIFGEDTSSKYHFNLLVSALETFTLQD